MKITINQLRKIIKEEVENLKPKIVLGGVYYNPEGEEINVNHIDDGIAYCSRYTGGPRPVDLDLPVEELQDFMVKNGFEFDHKETW